MVLIILKHNFEKDCCVNGLIDKTQLKEELSFNKLQSLINTNYKLFLAMIE